MEDTKLNELAKEIHENAVAHGWWDEERSLPEILMLCVSELSEALEEYRAGRPMLWHACEEAEASHPCDPKDYHDCIKAGKTEECRYYGQKPEGIAVEMADCMIRILDWCGREGIDIERVIAEKMAYNKTRPYRHGGKRC